MKSIINFSQKYLLDIALVVLIAYLLRVFLVDKHFYIQQQRLLTWMILLLITSLWLKRGVIKIPIDWIVVIFLLLFVMFLSVHSSNDYLKSSIKTTLDLSIIGVCFLIYINFETRISRNAKWIMAAIVLIFFTMSAFVTLQEMFISAGFNSTKLKVKSWGYHFFSHIRHFSYQAFIASAVSFILLATSRKQNVLIRCFFGIVFFCSLLCLLLAAGRASILALLVFIFINAFLQSGKFSVAIRSSALMLGLVCLCYLVLFFTPYDGSVKIVFSHFLKASQVANDGMSSSLNALSSGRLEVWQASLKYALESPVYGHGAASYIWSPLPSAGKYAHSHNAIIQFVLEYGYLGAIIIVYAMYKFLRPLFYLPKDVSEKEQLRCMVLSFVISYIVYSFFTGLFFHTLPMLQFAIMATLLFALSDKQIDKN